TGVFKYRRYVHTKVLDKWITVKPAYRITLECGTELISSGDHLLLSDRGWKHVVNSARGQPDRPHLTTRNHLVGIAAFAPQPLHDAEYRRGYLCGIIRGDGTLRSRECGRHLGTPYISGSLRLALADLEALHRAREFLVAADVDTSERVLQRAVGDRREMSAIFAGGRALFQRISRLIEWPVMPSVQWCRGFLAGIFDAEGCRSDYPVRIANTDPQILAWVEACARRLGFDTAVDRTKNANGLKYIRMRGGLSEHLRFFHLTDPAITRKRDIEGQMVKTFANLRVAEIEPLGRALPLYDITTGTGDFIANGVVSHNCFARPTHKYLDFDAGRDFEREIVV
ncbi:MAG: LAGLIDADG family homing endonuclease, partial [Solirubrobacteraceae bacterium]